MSLRERLLSIGGVGIFGDQIDYDPDVSLIEKEGKIFSNPRAFVEMQPNKCHWNIAELFDSKFVEKIIIGYALSTQDSWFQHTWGIKEEVIVETSKINFIHIKTYFGVALKNPKEFVELCRKFPAGSGKIRRSYITAIEN